jgi:hypothetical protein
MLKRSSMHPRKLLSESFAIIFGDILCVNVVADFVYEDVAQIKPVQRV